MSRGDEPRAEGKRDGGTLGGSGTVGNVLVQPDGALAPGASTGILHTGSLFLVAGADFFVEFAGTAAGTGYDQAAVTGTVDIAGANLAVSLLNGFDPDPGDGFAILANDGSDAIVGTFAGLAQGATFSAGDTRFQINYTGGDGNDIVLTATTVSTTDPNGNTTFTTIDAQGNQPWSSQSANFNNMGQQTGAAVNYRDGTVQSALFDTTGQAWSQQNFVFDQQGQLIASSTFFDPDDDKPLNFLPEATIDDHPVNEWAQAETQVKYSDADPFWDS